MNINWLWILWPRFFFFLAFASSLSSLEPLGIRKPETSEARPPLGDGPSRSELNADVAAGETGDTGDTGDTGCGAAGPTWAGPNREPWSTVHIWCSIYPSIHPSMHPSIHPSVNSIKRPWKVRRKKAIGAMQLAPLNHAPPKRWKSKDIRISILFQQIPSHQPRSRICRLCGTGWSFRRHGGFDERLDPFCLGPGRLLGPWQLQATRLRHQFSARAFFDEIYGVVRQALRQFREVWVGTEGYLNKFLKTPELT